ncbi:GNAT family N-acetyltransferase [Pseudoalteromonas sp. BDTF-M6]|uniref:GNAT family N-acetyltransferase n=1 Tax=Pseudoalteromonas sp. BDTF-M6 TaxID=2796132 RepID=UPI001BB002B3|nr:GNAT family N-acetyltransferase [Pseudoalteromonas sp. BDTF-M6]MBS3797840.1 GNAT family N-acetyltransferase [Pseudoalteromonas sp. BDTF-M6]
MRHVCETERLTIRQLDLSDAEFILRLLNEESFLRYIGDKKVRTREDALNHLTNGPMASYKNHGFGLNLVQLKGESTAIGMCGLLKREELDYPDLGYAFLPEFCGKGYAREAAEALLKQAVAEHSLHTILAVTAPNNLRSMHLLESIGFNLKGTQELYGLENNLFEYRSL